MLRTVLQAMYRSAALPAGERLGAADELFGHGALPMRLAPRPDREFAMVVRHGQLAPLSVMELAVTPAEVLRTRKLIRRADPHMLSLVLPLDGRLVLDQAGRRTVVEADRIALYDSSQPLEMTFAPAGAGGTATVLSAHAPRAGFALLPARLDRLLARPLPAGRGSGFGGLLAQLLTDVTGAGAYRQTDQARLGAIAHDLMSALVAHHLDAESALPDDTHRTTLLLRIDSFIVQHLHDALLTPAEIAAAHHISVSHLHRLFASRGDTTVAAWIRRQRLERARRDLADPAMRHVPVHRIATRWGFTTHSAFTRAFRSAYGHAPRDHRGHAAAQRDAG